MNNLIRKLAAGLVLTGAVSGASANIITNGGFEQGLTGWSCVGANVCSTQSGGVSGATMNGFANTGYASLSQTVSTEIGATYALSFFSKASVIQGNEIGYSFNGFNKVVWVPTTTAFAQSFGNFTALGTSTKVEFFLATNPGTGNYFVDSVSLVKTANAVPEPGALALLGLGLAGLFAARRQRQA